MSLRTPLCAGCLRYDTSVDQFVQVERIAKAVMEFPHVLLGAIHRKENVAQGDVRTAGERDIKAVLENAGCCEFRVGTCGNGGFGQRAHLCAQIVIVKIVGGWGCAH